jgi:hypothetical protein
MAPSIPSLRIPQQVLRLVLVFGVATVGFIIARSALVPDTFGDLGHYRALAVDSIAARGIKYAGHQRCAVCHRSIDQRRLEGHHGGLSCEVCHGPAMDHVNAPGSVKPAAPRERGLCPICHSYDAARPSGFPQIDPVAHNPRAPCVECHDPHEPEPPVAPEQCSACHGQIARQKAVSHHAILACTVCHETPDEHKIAPKDSAPTKPVTRDFCGGCHAEEAPGSERVPRVDLGDHGDGYPCWQCHYPHYPETGGP